MYMNLGQIKLLLLLTSIPLFGIFSQVSNHSSSSKQFNPKHSYSNPLHSKEFNPNLDINNYFYSYNTNKIKNSSSLLDSIVEICQLSLGNQKYSFYYDQAGRVNYYITQDWFNNKWENSLRNTYFYDSLGSLSFELMEILSAGQWTPWYRISYTYDEKRNQIAELFEGYKDSGWVNNYQNINKYESDGNLANQIHMQWNGKEWITNYQEIIFFKEGVRDSILFQDWVDGQWVNDKSAKPAYDNQGNLITMLWKTWSDTQWVNYTRGNWNYGLYKNIVSGLIEDWDGAQWINDSRFSYSYNSDNLFTHGINEIWQYDAWVIGNGIFYYDRSDIFDLAFNCADLTVYYKNTLGVDKLNILEGYSLAQNYPNPFNPSTTITYSLAKAGNVTLKIYDLLGKEVAVLVNGYKTKGQYNIKFEVSNLPSGIYIYQLNSNGYSLSKKMVILK
jgi:hypothetical protein